MKIKTTIFLLLLQVYAVSAQQASISKKLNIGDKIPDILLTHIINYPKSVANTSEFKNKLLLIDFWATNCSGCILAMPKLNKLQKEFKDYITILPVTYEKENLVKKFCQTNSFLRSSSLPSVTEDTILKKLFPHQLEPHEVWINTQGTVVAITGSEYVTGNNIRDLISKNNLQLTSKNDVMDFDKNKPLLLNGNGGNEMTFRFRSIITGYKPGLQAGIGIQIDTAKHWIRIYAINQSIGILYSLAFPTLNKDRQSLRTSNSIYNNNIHPQSADSAGKYCYEMFMPDYLRNDFREFIKNELDHYFSVKSKLIHNNTDAIDKLEITPYIGVKQERLNIYE